MAVTVRKGCYSGWGGTQQGALRPGSRRLCRASPSLSLPLAPPHKRAAGPEQEPLTPPPASLIAQEAASVSCEQSPKEAAPGSGQRLPRPLQDREKRRLLPAADEAAAGSPEAWRRPRTAPGPGHTQAPASPGQQKQNPAVAPANGDQDHKPVAVTGSMTSGVISEHRLSRKLWATKPKVGCSVVSGAGE